MNSKSRVSDKTSAGEKLTAIGFVFLAFAAVFLSVHKEELLAGRIVEVALSYLSS
ncbi:MAG: hypothetical protein AAGB10_12575 [Pseudomonadota bacterium]